MRDMREAVSLGAHEEVLQLLFVIELYLLFN